MVYPTLDIEKKLWDQGFQLVCGLDEVGRGSFAGPVVVGAAIFPPKIILPKGIADSKLLTPRKREELAKEIYKIAKFCAIAEICVECINKFGIGKATQMAFRKALQALPIPADFILIDAFFIQGISKQNQKAVKDGDKICASISAASIIAKVYRDKLMEKLSLEFPQYGLEKHKGYGTKLHQEAIYKYGLSNIHRTSFKLGKFLSSTDVILGTSEKRTPESGEGRILVKPE